MELERVFDICHGCRRCVNLCTAFPTLFDLVDASPTLEVDGVDKKDYWKVVDQCYLCDTCYMTKCPYVPPHAWNVDFPHLMLRAKAIKFQQGRNQLPRQASVLHRRDGQAGHHPGRGAEVNAVNRNKSFPRHAGKHAGRAQGPRAARICQRQDSGRMHGAQKHSTGQETARTHPAKSRSSPPATSTTTSPAWATTCSRCSRTTRSRTCSWKRKPAAACPSWNLAIWMPLQPQGHQYPAAREAGARGLCHPHADSLLHADVQAGAAAACSRTTRTCRR